MPETPYQEEIQGAIAMLSAAILRHRGPELQAGATGVDGEVRDILRTIGQGTVSQIWGALSGQAVHPVKQ